MNHPNPFKLFRETLSETAFQEVVSNHLPLVIGTAHRITQNSGLAEEIAQTVFILLANKARDLNPNTILAGWLHRTTRYVSLRAMDSESRRKKREQEAAAMYLNENDSAFWESLTPHLDQALTELPQADRDALLLRYMEE